MPGLWGGGEKMDAEGANKAWRETRIWIMEAVLDTHTCDICQHSSEQGCSGLWPQGERQAPAWHSSPLGALCQPRARLCGRVILWGPAWGLSQCIMDEGLLVPWLVGGCGWAWWVGVGSACNLGAEGIEGSA